MKKINILTIINIYNFEINNILCLIIKYIIFGLYILFKIVKNVYINIYNGQINGIVI